MSEFSTFMDGEDCPDCEDLSSTIEKQIAKIRKLRQIINLHEEIQQLSTPRGAGNLVEFKEKMRELNELKEGLK